MKNKGEEYHMVNKEIELQSLISQSKILIDKHNVIQKNTGGLADEIKKHTSEIQSEIDKANQSVKRQVTEVAQVVNDEGKSITDTLK